MTDGVKIPFVPLSPEAQRDFERLRDAIRELNSKHGEDLGRQMALNAIVATGGEDTATMAGLWFTALEGEDLRDLVAHCYGNDGRIVGLEVDFGLLLP